MSQPELDAAERERRRELTSFLRAHRARLLPPVHSGHPARRRRTPGLRREEVAERAGMSPVWYSWLERGRPIKVSAAMLERVAQALELNADETGHLFALVGKAEPPRKALPEVLPDAVRNVLKHYANPACIFGARLDILAANEAFSRMFHHPPDEDEWQRNVLWRAFTDPEKRRQHADWVEYARNLTAMFRVSYAHHLGDPRFEGLIERLKEVSPEFVQMWQQQLIVRRLIRQVAFSDGEDEGTVMEVVHLPMPWDPLQTIVFLNPVDAAPTTEPAPPARHSRPRAR